MILKRLPLKEIQGKEPACAVGGEAVNFEVGASRIKTTGLHLSPAGLPLA